MSKISQRRNEIAHNLEKDHQKIMSDGYELKIKDNSPFSYDLTYKQVLESKVDISNKICNGTSQARKDSKI